MTTTLVKFDAARFALAEARSVDEVKDVRDKAEALRLYAKQRGESHEMQNDIAEIKLRAERRLGELLAEKTIKGGERHKLQDETYERKPTLPEGISKMQSHRWQKEAQLPEEDFERFVAKTRDDGGELTSTGLYRTSQRHLQQAMEDTEIIVPLPAGKHHTIVIDPPWDVTKILREERPNQDAFDYPTMTDTEIAALPIDELANDLGCHVYLWVTHKKLPIGLDLFERWGVRYQCIMTWVKPTGMTPFSWMYDTEHVLFGRIGSLKLERMGLKLSFEAPVTRHSEKPNIFYERVAQASPGPRLEMFARQPHEGFIPWGNEVL